MKRISLFILITALSASALIIACGGGGGGGGSSTVSLSASLGSTYEYSYVPSLTERVAAFFTGSPALALVPQSVDKVVAIPLTENGATFMGGRVESTIASDGSFSLSLDTSYTWVVLLVDSLADKENMVVGYVTVGDGTESMVAFNADQASGSVDYGELNDSPSGEAQSQFSMNDMVTSFNYTLAQLQSIARADDVYKKVINNYINYDESAGTAYETIAVYGWMESQSSVIGTYGDPASFNFNGVGIYVQAADDTISSADICSKAVTLTFTPPSAVSYFDSSETATFFENDGTMETYQTSGCYETDGEFRVTPTTGGFFAQWSVFDRLPEGYWYLSWSNSPAVSDSLLAVFDFGDSAPMDDSGNPLVFVPVPRVNVDGNDILTSVDIQWMQYNGVDGYEVADTSVVNALGNYISLSIWGVDYTEVPVNRMTDFDAGSSVLAADLLNAWLISPTGASSAQSVKADGLKIDYGIAGDAFSFNFENP